MKTFSPNDKPQLKEKSVALKGRYSLLWIMATLLCFLCLNCNTTKPIDNGQSNGGPQLGDVLEVKKGSVVKINSEQLSLSIDKVAEGRCPVNVQCIHAGEGKVFLTVAQGTKAFNVTLIAKGLCQETDGSCGETIVTNGYTFTLVTLSPYPGVDDGSSIKQEDYVAHIKVGKGGSGMN